MEMSGFLSFRKQVAIEEFFLKVCKLMKMKKMKSQIMS